MYHSLNIYDLSVQFRKFLNGYSEKINNLDPYDDDFSAFEKYPLLTNQAIYIFCFKTRSFPFNKGIENLLGYSTQEFDYELFTSYYHPDDFPDYWNKVENVNKIVQQLKPMPYSFEYSINVRVRKKDGSFIKLLRQSTVHQSDENGHMLRCFSVLTDITSIKKSDYIECSASGNGEVVSELNKFFKYKYHNNFFSPREREVLKYLQLGQESIDIGKQMKISRHTVDTFRRRMLSKSGCKNTLELVDFSKRNGIL